jgi:hypothetical protein
VVADRIRADAGAGAGVLRPGELPGQDAARERAPGGDGQAEVLGHRQQVALDVALQQAVGHLQAGERRPAVSLPPASA